MKYMESSEIRRTFLEFFEKKGHKILPSASLVPNDPQLLFTVAGMVPFKPIFWGKVKPVYRRVATCQKCIRTTDIENVGKTPRHHTFFEMLGNFSFGDYFKEKAIEWAWEFVTQILEVPEDKLWISVYEEDEEAYKIWSGLGIPEYKIVKMGKEDNFWGPVGPTGPCGPDTEIFYDTGIEVPTIDGKSPTPANTEGRFVEIWNLVFTEFYQDESGKLHPLEKKNIDTGAGLERIAAMMQGVYYNFDTDLFEPIIKRIEEVLGVKYKDLKKTDVSIRVIADHVRAVTFLIADGVLPSNEGRGYVLRRILRRALRHGALLNSKEPFLYKVVDAVVEKMGSIYPQIKKRASFIKEITLGEEERFLKNLSRGLELVEKIAHENNLYISGENAFKLYDTYGFPIDILKDIAEENGYELDEEGFEKYMSEQRERARAALGNVEFSKKTDYENLNVKTEFVGYEKMYSTSKVLSIKKGNNFVEHIENSEGEIVLSVTPFYPEKGGQVADTGVIKGPAGEMEVVHVYSPVEGVIVHKGYVSGRILVNDMVEAKVDTEKRKYTMKNHTATHILHAALRKLLGEHVKQAGSLVEPRRLRFDFTHYKALSKEEIVKIENLVNDVIMRAIPVVVEEKAYSEAVREGAVALFEEKYGDVVRVVKVGEFSEELCGGTHVHNTGEIGLFKIVSESSVSAGVRRIEAITGMNFLEKYRELTKIVDSVKDELEVSENDMIDKIQKYKEEIKKLKNEIKQLRSKNINFDEIFKNSKNINKIKFVTAVFEGMDSNVLREVADKLIDKGLDLVALFNVVSEDKILIVVKRKKGVENLHSGNIAKELARILGGGGGGRPDFAQAGGKLKNKLPEAIERLESLIKEC
ncbi:alanine--tRNA ligase [Thermosipho ferrireducens]|uniref:Alanine--tRNA ligase n=1 Tax=Thermosipho ferrireducens TaxID=2571116 RepID=A0ABX7S4A2_9BACT|nr:alanine--tRNA ligase [Thermosipho ferrireducens]QTA37252.1 alanine--tRNA ligase [Thermosipho ferrireducens]